MIKLREYQKTDLEAYLKFSKNNFGVKSYQSNPRFISWLETNPSRSLKIALKNNEIIGCSHGYQVPIISKEEIVSFFIVHDIMTDRKNRKAGIKLIKDCVLKDQPVLLSGASGKISEMYKRIGATKVDSCWYRKILMPKRIFKKKSILNIEKIELKGFPGFNLYNNKMPKDKNNIEQILKKFKSTEEQESFLNWRFFGNNAPISYFLSSKENRNCLIFSLGRSNFFPFIRIHSIVTENEESKENLIKYVEKFASENGILIVLVSLISKNGLPEELNYKPYKTMPNVYWLSRDKTKSLLPIIEGFHTDMGFNGYI